MKRLSGPVSPLRCPKGTFISEGLCLFSKLILPSTGIIMQPVDRFRKLCLLGFPPHCPCSFFLCHQDGRHGSSLSGPTLPTSCHSYPHRFIPLLSKVLSFLKVDHALSALCLFSLELLSSSLLPRPLSFFMIQPPNLP